MAMLGTAVEQEERYGSTRFCTVERILFSSASARSWGKALARKADE